MKNEIKFQFKKMGTGYITEFEGVQFFVKKEGNRFAVYDSGTNVRITPPSQKTKPTAMLRAIGRLNLNAILAGQQDWKAALNLMRGEEPVLAF